MGGKLFGFKSGTTWKKALACIWYIGWLACAVIAAIAGPTVECSPFDATITRLAGAFLFVGIAALPLLLSDFQLLKKIPLLNGEKAWQKAIGLVIFALVWLLLFGAINSLHSSEYQSMIEAQTAQQRAEQEAKRAEEEAAKQREAAEKEAAEQKKREEEEAAKKQAEQERKEAESTQSSQEAEPSSGSAVSESSQSAEPEQAPAEQAADNSAKADFVRTLVSEWGFSEAEANDAYSILENVGCGDIKMMEGRMTEGTSLDAMRGMVGSHQVNFTADNKQVFYVQITGWKEMDYGWYVNWRGKLKYGIVDKKLSFDLYDSDNVDGGYIAYYDANQDAVVPWGESL